MMWTLAPTQEAQTLENHEYLEFRYGELFFNNTGGSAGVSVDDLNVSAWVLRLPTNNSAVVVTTSDDALNSVFELSRYTIEMAPLDLYVDSNSRQRSASCIADDVTSMEIQYAATDQLALQRYATEQVLAVTGPQDTTGGRPDWAILGIIAVHHHLMCAQQRSLSTLILCIATCVHFLYASHAQSF